MSIERYGIDKKFAHPKAVNWFPEKFFWSCADELSPFGSDEGDTALADYRQWRRHHPTDSLFSRVVYIIESIGGMRVNEYNRNLLKPEIITKQIQNPRLDHRYRIETLDITLIATGFGQFVDEGKIDSEIIQIMKTAIERQILYNKIISMNPSIENLYHDRLIILQERLYKLEVHQTAGDQQ